MNELNISEVNNVYGGNPAAGFVPGALVGGLIYDGIKFIANELASTPRRTSSGGQMSRNNGVASRIQRQ